MKPGLLQQLLLYRYRYWVGHALLALAAIVFFTWQLSSIGPGLTDAAKQSAVASNGWTWSNWQDTLQVVDVPFALLQKASIFIFGLSSFSVRLPSALCALGSCLLFFLLARRLHRPYVATIASALFVGASWHVGIGRSGTALAMIPFVWLAVVYTFVRLVRLDDPPLVWAALAGIATGTALYTPYGCYAVLASVVIVAVHPDIRRRVQALNAQQTGVAVAILALIVLPLLWGCYKNPDQLWELLGLTSQLPGPAEFVRNAAEAIKALIWHAPYLPSLRLGNLPLLDLGTVALLVAGLYRTIADWRSMRSQFILCGLLLLLIITSLHPQSHHYTPLIIPVYLLVAAGVTVLFREWYKLFPRNPYARSFGLIPIIVLLGFIMAYHYQRYFVAWASAPSTYHAYDDDLTLVRSQLTRHPTLVMAVEPKDVAFYTALTTTNHTITVTDNAAPIGTRPFLSAAALPKPNFNPATQSLQPITNDDAEGSLRFWLVSPINK